MKKHLKIAVILMIMLTALFLCTMAVSAEGGVCYINDNAEATYETLTAALSAASTGDTIHLLADAVYDSGIKSVTIDGTNAGGANHTLTLNKKMQIMHADVTLSNVTVKINGEGIWVVEVETGKTSKLTLASGAVLDGENIKKPLNGGAIELTQNAGTAEVIMQSGSTIQNCGIASGGGAIYMNGGTVTVNDGAVIKDCTADGHGGAINVNRDTSNLVLAGGTITGCTAKGNGGAIYVGIGTVKLSGNVSMTGNKKGDTTLTENNIQLTNAGQLSLTGNLTGSVGVTFSGAQTGTAFGTAASGVTGAEKLKLDTDTTITGLNDNGTLYFIKDGEAYVGTDKFNRKSLNEAITGASAGAVIHLTKNANLGTEGGSFSTGKKVTIDGTGEGANFTITLKCMIQLMHADFTFTNVNIKTNGKYFWVIEPGTKETEYTKLTVGSGCVIDGENIKGNNLGGAIKVERNNAPTKAEVILKSGSVIKNCGATVHGGAIYLGNGTLTVESGAIIKDCAADNLGGAIYMVQNDGKEAKLILNGGTIENCTAEGNGGAIYAASGTVELSGNVSITGNKKGNTTLTENNLQLASASQLKLTGNLTGSVGVTLSGAKGGTAFGTAASGVTGAEKLKLDTDNTVTGVIDNGTLYFFKDGEAYIGTDKFNRKSLRDAFSAASAGDTIHLTKNAEFGNSNGEELQTSKGVIVDGTGVGANYSVTLTSNIKLLNTGSFKFKNVTVKLNSKKFLLVVTGNKTVDFTLGSGAVLDGENKELTGNGGAIEINQAEGTVAITLENGSTIKNCKCTASGGAIFAQGGTVTLNSGALIQGCEAVNKGGAIYMNNGARTNKLILSGGTIENCKSGVYGGAVYAEVGTVELSGNIKILGNTVGENANNLQLGNASQFELKTGFTGSVGVTLYGTTVGASFGTAASGVTGVKSVKSLISDSLPSAFGAVNNGSLIWQSIPQISVETFDSGIYGEEGAEDKGIIRILTKFNKVPETVGISGFGTYALTGAVSEDKASHLGATTKFYKNATGAVTKDSGYTVDIYTGAQTSINAVSFFYISGVTDPIFSTVHTATANSENVLDASLVSEKKADSDYYRTADSLQ